MDIVTIPAEAVLSKLEEVNNKLDTLLGNKKSEYITINEIVKKFGLSRSTINNRVRDGFFTKYKIGNLSFFKMEEIEKAITESKA